MIIPTPYEDELLYSIIARYKAWNGIILDSEAMYNLFDSKNKYLYIDLPTNLNVIGQRAGYDIDFLIHETTLFDFYSLFKNKWIRDDALSMMQGNKRNTLEYALGIYNKEYAKPNFIRFCPECWEEDIKISGESYWRKLHQAPGVVICPKHHRILHNSRLSSFFDSISNANEKNCFPSKPVLNLNKRELSLSLKIAKEIQWVFKNYKTVSKYDSLSPELYLSKIIETNYILNDVLYTVSLNKTFIERIKKFYGEELINEWNLNIDNSWLYKTIFGFSNHPLSHILLIIFLYGSIRNLTKVPDFLFLQHAYHQKKENWFTNNMFGIFESDILEKVQSYKHIYINHKYINHYEIPKNINRFEYYRK